MEKISRSYVEKVKLLKHKFILLFLLVMTLGCEKSKLINEAIAPCENEFINNLVPIKKIATNVFFNSNLWYGSRTSDKYLVTCGDIGRNYKYIVVNHQTHTLNFFERPYVLGFPLSDSRLYQIHDDHLYLARLDRSMGWMLEAIHLETMNSEGITIKLGNESPKEILQVEKHENTMYILAVFEKTSAIFAYSILEKKLKIVYNASDDLYTTGFKVKQYDQNNLYIIRAAIDSINNKTIIEGINLDILQPFYSNTYDRILVNYNYPYEKEMLPFDSDDRLYLNFDDSKSTIIEAKTGRTVSNSDKHIVPFSSDYALTYRRIGQDIDHAPFDIINPVTGQILIDAKWGKKFNKSVLLNPSHLLIRTYYDWKVLNLVTQCVEHKNFGDFYLTKENEFITIDSDGLYFYKL